MQRLQQAHDDGVVVGLSDFSGSEPVERLDIDVLLLNHPDTFNLLLIAFKELKDEPVPWEIDDGYKASTTDKMYWFQIAGIHGLPQAHWDGETGRNRSEEKSYGYCVHGTPLFCPWHRPYLAMLEQSLYRQAANIVERFERSTKLSEAEKQTYRDALKQLRLPYWDYFRPRAVKVETKTYDYHVPLIFTRPQVMIKTLPNNELKSLDNPFFHYKFPKDCLTAEEWALSGMSLLQRHDIHESTVRWSGNEEGNVKALNNMVNMIREDNMRMVLLMVDDEDPNGYPNFQVFSHDGLPKTGIREKDYLRGLPRFGSLESTHGTYHVYVGGFAEAFYGQDIDIGTPNEPGKNTIVGHLMAVPLSAFDPIFWAHHCQIDRLFAIWQAINPGEEGSKTKHWFGDITGSDRGIEEQPLYPFRRQVNPEKLYWHADEARYTKTFGYTYPDIEVGQSPKQIRARFKERYEWSRRLQPSASYGPCPDEMLPLDLSQAQVYKDNQIQQMLASKARDVVEFTESFLAAAPTEPQADFAYEWFIDVVVERMALNNSFTIFFMLGDTITGKTGAQWGLEPGFVGVAHIFTSPRETCANCDSQAHEHTLVTQTVPMASSLYDLVNKGELASVERQHVEPYLKKNLKWRVQAVDGRVVDPRTLAESHGFQLGISVRISPLQGQDVAPREERLDRVIEDIIRNSSEKAGK